MIGRTKRSKGSITESPWTVWAVVIFAGITVATIFFLRTYYIDYAAILKTPSEKLQSVEAANAIKSCLQDGKLYVTRELLDESKGKSVEEICGLSKPHANAYLKDMETGQTWLFPSYVGEPDHEIWVPIAYSEFDEITNTNQNIPAGEYVIYAKWYGVGMIDIRANDILIALYPSALYPPGAEKVQSVNYAGMMQWMNGLKDGEKEGTGKVTIPAGGAVVTALVPSGFKLTGCSEVGDLASVQHEACVKVFRGASEIHLGRLYVDVNS
jgi:hypothetical protein